LCNDPEEPFISDLKETEEAEEAEEVIEPKLDRLCLV